MRVGEPSPGTPLDGDARAPDPRTMARAFNTVVVVCAGAVAFLMVGCGDSSGDGGGSGGGSSGPGGLSGNGIEAMCDDACECEECDDDRRDTCLEEGTNAETYAKDAGCEDELDAILDCIAKRGACDDGKFRLTDQCEKEADAIDECTGGAVHADDGYKPLDKD